MYTNEAAQVTGIYNRLSHYYILALFMPTSMFFSLCCVLRLDGSAEPSNEILEQGSHDRPLVAQTYSAAVTKGMTHQVSELLCRTTYTGSIVAVDTKGDLTKCNFSHF